MKALDEPEWDDAAIERMRDHFLVPPRPEEVFVEFDGLVGALATSYGPIAAAFRQNIVSLLSTVAVPFAMASSSTERSHFQRLHIAERIRARSIGASDIPPGEDLETVRSREAHRKAVDNVKSLVESESGKALISRDISHLLLSAIRHDMRYAAQELLLQGLVLLWSALEVLARDTFEALLNRSPARIQALMDNPSTRKRFDAEKLSLGTLVDHGFDLSQQLGTILVAQQDFSNLPTVKSVYSALFPAASALHETLGNRDLWTLYQRRHLIVHRRGVIDRAYLENSGDSGTLGSRIVVRPSELEHNVTGVVAVGSQLCRCLTQEGDGLTRQ